MYIFDGTSGEVIWSQEQVHEGGILSSAIHPVNDRFVTGGQDGKIIIWSTYQKKKRENH